MPNIEINGTVLHYTLEGPENDNVVLLSNSLASNHTMWDPQIPELTAAGYRVLRYDSRGHGSSAAPKGPYSMTMLADDAVGLLDALGLDRVHFCGLSKGGMTGQMLGTNHSHRFHSLTLCDTSSHMPPQDLWEERIEMARQGGMESVVDATIDRWFTKEGQQRLPDEVAKVRKMILNTPVEGFSASCHAIQDMDQRESIRAISLPVLVMVGEQDPSTPVEMARKIQENIPGAELEIIPEAAHLSNVEQSEYFNRALIAFLQQNRTD